MHELVVDARGGLADALAVRLEREAAAAVAARGRFAIALPGGSVATAFFPRLSRCALDRARTHFFWGDERAVPPGDPASNYAVARRLWLAPARVPGENVHRMAAEGPDLDAAAAAYERELVAELGTPPALDLALAGVGPDGHVCSLFPGDPLLGEDRRWVAAVLGSPKPPPHRLTLTLPALGAAALVVVAALGAEKAEAVREALERPGSSLPVALALSRARRSLVLVDPGAASLLARRG